MASAATESFFSSLKIERVARKAYRTRDHAKPMCSTSSNASTFPGVGTRRSGIWALWSSKRRCC